MKVDVSRPATQSHKALNSVSSPCDHNNTVHTIQGLLPKKKMLCSWKCFTNSYLTLTVDIPFRTCGWLMYMGPHMPHYTCGSWRAPQVSGLIFYLILRQSLWVVQICIQAIWSASLHALSPLLSQHRSTGLHTYDHTEFSMVLRTWTQVLTFVPQALYSLSHLPSPVPNNSHKSWSTICKAPPYFLSNFLSLYSAHCLMLQKIIFHIYAFSKCL